MHLFNILRGRRDRESGDNWTPVQLSGGSGGSEDDAVVVHTTNRVNGVDAEYQRLDEIFGKRGVDWELHMQLLKEIDGRNLDVFKIKLGDGTQHTYVFDISEYR